METSRKKMWLLAALLILLALAVYIPVMRADFAIDDSAWVTENKALRMPDGVMRYWIEIGSAPHYCPLVSTSFWFEYRIWRLNPFGYHLDNILLHALSAILLWLILRRLSVPGAWPAAAVFLIHPVQVESLAWVSERKNILSGLFYLAAMLIYFRFSPPDENHPISTHRWRYYILSLFLFTCALLSKTVAFSMPAAILLIFWWKRERIALKDVYYLIPMFLLGVGATLVAMRVESFLFNLEGISELPGGANIGGDRISIIDRGLIAGRALWFYTGKLLWPLHLTCFYARWQINSRIWWQYLFPLGAVVVLALLWITRSRTGRGPLTAVLFFIGTLSPLLGFVNHSYMLFSFISDHFQYMACIGLIALGTAFGAILFKRLGPGYNRIEYLSCGIVILSLGALSWQQGNIYHTKVSLWQNNIIRSPGSAVAQYNIGYFLLNHGEYDKAISYFNEAIRLWPNYAEAHNNLGLALYRQGKITEATTQFYEAVRINPENPKAQNNLGSALAQAGKLDEAIQHFNESLRINPNNAKAQSNLASALTKQGKLDDAIVHFSIALDLNPSNADTHCNLGLIYLQKGEIERAIREFNEALAINPNFTKAREKLQIALEKRNMGIQH